MGVSVVRAHQQQRGGKYNQGGNKGQTVQQIIFLFGKQLKTFKYFWSYCNMIIQQCMALYCLCELAFKLGSILIAVLLLLAIFL